VWNFLTGLAGRRRTFPPVGDRSQAASRAAR
jgi:hypothetical protein